MIYEFDQFQVDVTAFEVRRGRERLITQPQVLELLILLLAHQDRVVSKDEIHGHVWKGRTVSDTALSSRIKSLRQLLGDDGETQKYIRTIHGRGFRFVGDAKTVDPGNAPKGKISDAPVKRPQTRYAKSGNVHIAYQVYGNGPVHMIMVPGFVSHIENYWDSPAVADWLIKLGEYATVTLFDKRGTGLSDSVGTLPGMDVRMDDVRVVMEAVGWDRAFIMGISEGGSLAALFAATYPQQCQGLILYGAFANFTSWFPTKESLQGLFDYIETSWGSGKSLPNFAPSVGSDADSIEWWGKFERLGATPGAAIALMSMNNEIDISQVLPTIQVPTVVIHRNEDVLIDFEAAQFLAREIPKSKLVELPGKDHLPWIGGNTDQIIAAIGKFLADDVTDVFFDTVLTTVLCVCIRVSENNKGSAAEEWRDAATNAIRHRILRFRGREIAPREGFHLAVFDGPARALHCAIDIAEAMSDNKLAAGVAVHTGEVRFGKDDVSGLPLDMAVQIAGMASDNQVLVTRTVKELTAGSGLQLKPVKMSAESPNSVAQNLFQAGREPGNQ